MNRKTTNSSYGNDSITSLKGADRVRKRPSVIFGSDGIKGCQHSFFEILSNSIDEAREGYGKKIRVIRHEDLSISVIDNGRGIPVDYNEKEGKFNWELVFCELYAGGKYQNNSGENYQYSLGLNGLGTCATQYSSEYMSVEIHRDGFKYELEFKKGDILGEMIKTPSSRKQTGSSTKWRPDIEVFTDINIELDYFKDVMKKQSIVNPGVTFELYDEELNETFQFFYENGIIDYLKELDEDKGFTQVYDFQEEGTGRDREDKPDYRVKFQMAFCFNNSVNSLEYFHNSSPLEHGGSPEKAIKNAFVYEIDRYLKKNDKYNKTEKKINFQDVEDSLILVSNSFSTVTSYENQTKKAITNKFIQEFMTKELKKHLEIYFIENKTEAEKIANQVLINKRSRENAEKTRLNIKKKLSGKLDINNRVKKFVNCRTKNVEEREIYIVEGDSALGACKLARDANFQALLPVRGKILNCLKAEYGKIFSSDIVVDILKVLGCGVEIKSKSNKEISDFNLENLRWDKVIICTDADVDGFQIRTLILTLFYRLVPSLIKEGKIYIAESPLFEINTKNNTYFAYSEKEKNEITKKLKGKFTIQRSKGLGENDPDMMWKTTMSPDTRRLIRVDYYNEEDAEMMFDVLLGENLDGRKQFIEENGEKYIDLIDVV